MDGNNDLAGGLGDDRLFGESGDDSLDGGEGSDWLEGGAGDDLYLVDNLGDVVFEQAGGGIDGLGAVVDFALPDEVEVLRLGGLANIGGTGNAANHIIGGNDWNNVLAGGLGDDLLLAKRATTPLTVAKAATASKAARATMYIPSTGSATPSLRLPAMAMIASKAAPPTHSLRTSRT